MENHRGYFKTLESKVDPQHTALIVVDMQKEFCDTSELAGRLELKKEEFISAIDKMSVLIESARKSGVKVIYTQEIDDPKYMSEPMWERLFRKNMRPYCLSGTKGIEIVDELAVQPGDEVVTKHRFSAFFATNLDILLRSSGIKTCVFIGTQTNVCVDSTARDAYFRDYYVVVVDDCTFTYDPVLHNSTLKTIDEAFGVVVSSRTLVEYWQR